MDKDTLLKIVAENLNNQKFKREIEKGINRQLPNPTIEKGIGLILKGLKELYPTLDLKDENLEETPQRVAKMYAEICEGLGEDPRIHLRTGFEADKYDEVVIVKDLPIISLCAHHFAAIKGYAHIAYIPTGKVVGLSKLARVVEGYARRPQLQERLTNQIATAIQEELKPLGVAVVCECTHDCMNIRGVRAHSPVTTTSTLLGAFMDKPQARQEFMTLIMNRKNPS